MVAYLLMAAALAGVVVAMNAAPTATVTSVAITPEPSEPPMRLLNLVECKEGRLDFLEGEWRDVKHLRETEPSTTADLKMVAVATRLAEYRATLLEGDR